MQISYSTAIRNFLSAKSSASPEIRFKRSRSPLPIPRFLRIHKLDKSHPTLPYIRNIQAARKGNFLHAYQDYGQVYGKSCEYGKQTEPTGRD